jgi:serine/threonine protein phosphatase PrpC
MTLALRYAVRSDVGLLREGNEDSAYAGPHLLAVADGMGGHAAGEVASAATITTIAALDAGRPGADLVNALADAVGRANVRLRELIIADPATEGMGTTLTAILWADGHAALGHIGDSRAYLLRNGQFYQITHDHTLVQSLVDEGKITEDDIATHPHRSLLLRALDGRTIAEPDLSVHETVAGDRYLLCSDGLSGVVTEQTLHHTLSTVWDPDKAALRLIELAIKGGGPDNITCIVADVVDTETTAQPPTRAPVMAGAAANGAPTGLHAPVGRPNPTGPQRPSSPATRAMHLARTAPQPSVPAEDDPLAWGDDGNGYGTGGFAEADEDGFEDLREPVGPAGPGGTGPRATSNGRRGSHGAGSGRGQRGRYDDDDDATGRREAKRRWPIVTSVLVLLVLVVGGGLVAGWQYVRGQYYIGDAGGHVAIFRGVNEDVAGISLSSLVQQYSNVPLSQLVAQDQDQIAQTISYGSLRDAQTVAGQLQQSVTQCRQQYAALVTWQSRNTRYQTALTAYNHLPAAAKRSASKPTPPPAEPPVPVASKCAAPAAFGIQASALPGNASNSAGRTTGQPGGETPTTTPSAKSTPTHVAAKSTPTSGKSA